MITAVIVRNALFILTMPWIVNILIALHKLFPATLVSSATLSSIVSTLRWVHSELWKRHLQQTSDVLSEGSSDLHFGRQPAYFA